MTTPLALDTSVAVPLLLRSHRAHGDVVAWCRGRPVALCGHAAVETYAVLTRLPGDARLDPVDAARLLTERLAPPLLLRAQTLRRLPTVLAAAGVAGGAIYDALVALAALEHGVRLATRDGRARDTYLRLGVDVEIAA